MSRVPSVSMLVLALACACGGAQRTPRSCQQDADCGSTAYCLTGVCIAGALPEARIQIVGAGAAIVSHHRVTFDGNTSTDPNPQHKVTAFRWAVKPASQASCEASPPSGTEAALTTVFQCAGDYEVRLTVKNSLGLESAPVAQGISVGRSTNPPVIQGQAPDLVLDHVCDGSPLVCRPVTQLGDGRFPLFVAAADVESGDALAYEWQVDAPPGADRGAVAFEPDRFSRTPTVRIASAGAIAGDWTFRVLVSDSDGLTTPGQVKVTIANQPPALSYGAPAVAFAHQYADNVYRAHGTVKVMFHDPEGDAVPPPDVALVESAPTDCIFTVPSIAAGADGSYEATAELTCARADELIGAVERRLDIALHDANGAASSLSLPFSVIDNPPTLMAGPALTDHHVQACPLPVGSCFAAAGRVPVPFDPDGDPVVLVGLAPVGLDHGIWSADVASGAFTVQTGVDFPGAFRRPDGTSPVSVRATVADPWRTADATFALSIPNHAPAPAALGAASPAIAYASGQYLARGTVAVFVDEDGDPIGAVQGGGDPACTSFSVEAGVVAATCTRAFDWTTNAPPPLQGFAGAALPVSVSVSDPWERSATVAATVTPATPAPPVIASGSQSIPRTCSVCSGGVPVVPCANIAYAPSVTSAGLPVQVDAQVVATGSTPGSSAHFDCLEGDCRGAVDIYVCQAGVTVSVQARNGWATTNPQAVLVSTTCANDPCAGTGGGGTCAKPPCPAPR